VIRGGGREATVKKCRGNVIMGNGMGVMGY
jgi:hypothetical protein